MLRPLHETTIQGIVSTVYLSFLRFFSYVTWLTAGKDVGAGD